MAHGTFLENSSSKSSLTAEQQELLAMLGNELQSHLEMSLDVVHTADNDFTHLQEVAENIESFASAAELMGLQGLAGAWHALQENFLLLATEKNSLSDNQRLLVDSWVMFFLDFLQQLSTEDVSADSVMPVINYLADNAWPKPLSAEQQLLLTQELLHAQVTVSEDNTQRLPKIAQASMLSLALSEDINPDLFEGLMIELPTQVAQFTEQLNQFIHHRNKHALASAQRIAHTLKGSANVVGISGLANFMHFCEDLLEEIAKHDEALTVPLKNLLTDVADTLATMLDSLLEGDNTSDAIGNIELAVMQQVLDAYHNIREEGFAGFVANANPVVAETIPNETLLQSFNEPLAQPFNGSLAQSFNEQLAAEDILVLEKTTFTEKTTATEKVASGEETITDSFHVQTPHLQETLAAHLRIKEETAQDLLRLAGESAISTNRLQTQVQDVKGQVQHINQLHSKLTQLTEEFGHLIEVRELFNNRTKNISDDGFDPLELDRYNELHSFFHQLQEFAIDTRDAISQTQGQLRQLEDLTYEQQVTNRASQNHLLEMRMIPANHFEARFQRCVRQACRLTGKQARFVLQGGETMIDSRILHELVDPLMHLLRNAVDHGIESIEERENSGKAAEGLVELQFAVQGQSIVIRVTDDGAGLQRERIAQKAMELSLTPPVDANPDITDHWLKQIIFAAGFSTRDHVSQTSGRGIGLDMVADRVNELKGRITVDSHIAQGCEFSIRLPMPMIAEQGLLVVSGKHRLAISARGVAQLLFLETAALTHTNEQWQYQFNQQTIDVFTIAQLAQLPDVVPINPNEAHALLIVESLPGQFVGVLVERVLASREIVVKPLTLFTPSVPGVIGATILGDGGVAPVIDIQHLVLNLLQSGNKVVDWDPAMQRMHAEKIVNRPMALIVDDSLSTRRSLAQFVGDLGLDVRTAKDGFEAIEIMQEKIPHIMLVDMEMPRMNGLELTAHVRANEITKHIPVIMITSRNTDKHRNLAAAAGVDTYLNKPFSEEELLQHIQENMPS